MVVEDQFRDVLSDVYDGSDVKEDGISMNVKISGGSYSDFTGVSLTAFDPTTGGPLIVANPSVTRSNWIIQDNPLDPATQTLPPPVDKILNITVAGFPLKGVRRTREVTRVPGSPQKIHIHVETTDP
jgi:hypothetical protein